MSGLVCDFCRRRHRNRLGLWTQGLRIARLPEEAQRIRLCWMLMDPVVMGSADSDEVLDCVWSTLRASKHMMRIDWPETLDLGDRSHGTTATVTVEHLFPDLFRNSESVSFPASSSKLVSETGLSERRRPFQS